MTALIFSHPRCGSSNLLRFLRHACGVRGLAEPFNVRALDSSFPSWRTASIKELAGHFRDVMSTAPIAKHIYGQQSAEIDKIVVGTPGIHAAVFLYRENVAAAALSSMLAAQSGSYDTKISNSSVHIDLDQLKHIISQYNHRRARALEQCSSARFPVNVITYEDLFLETESVKHQKLQEIIQFFCRNANCPEPTVSSYDEAYELYLAPDRKINTQSTYDLISNANEVKKEFPRAFSDLPDGNRHQKLNSFVNIKKSFANISEFLNSSLDDGLKKIDLGRTDLYLYTRKLPGKPLIVFFSPAAIRGENRNPPFFSGAALTEDIDASLLLVDDPSLQLGEQLGLAWHTGYKGLNLQRILPDIIKYASSEMSSSRVILTGPSGGGFASLLYGTLIPGSIVLAVNPQTIITRYDQSAVERYARVCFDWDEKSPIKEAIRPTIQSLPWHFLKGARAKGYFIQNESDWHVSKHTLPLIEALGGEVICDQTLEGISFIFRNWGKGHAPLPKRAYKKALENLVNFGDSRIVNELDEVLEEKMF